MCSALEGKSQHIFTWTIDNFRGCAEKNGCFLDCPDFVAESLDKTMWSVMLYPSGNSETTKEFISIFLRRSNNCTGPDKVKCDFQIKVFDENNELIQDNQDESEFKRGSSMGWKEFIEREGILNNKALTIEVTLKRRLPKLLTKNSCYTKITTNEFSFKWNIMNSSGAQNKSVSFLNIVELELTIEILEDDVEISITGMNGFVNSEILLCTVTLLDSKGKEAVSKEAVFEADEPHDVDTDTWKFPTFLKKSEIFENNIENHFTLKFEMALSVGGSHHSMKNIEGRFLTDIFKTVENRSASLKTDLERVFTDRVHTDVELHVGEQVIHAHKVILCARSPVFLAMFNQDMVENQTGVIKISDVEIETLISMLKFMYTGDTELMGSEVALELLLAANKYQVSSLKEKCASCLELFLSDDNVCDILFTADLIQLETLKVCAVDYIKEKPKKIFQSEGWKELLDKNFKLASEVFCKVSTF